MKKKNTIYEIHIEMSFSLVLKAFSGIINLLLDLVEQGQATVLQLIGGLQHKF